MSSLETCGLRYVCACACSGVLEAGTYALCANKGKKERIGRLLMMHANNREDVKVAHRQATSLLWPA